MACPTALSDKSISLLYEIYEVPKRNSTVLTGGLGTSGNLNSFDYQVGVREQLESSIVQINANLAEVKRVEEILGEYDDLSLDRSTIDRDGYSLRPDWNISAIRQALYPYTGIAWVTNRGNKTPLGR